MREIKKLSELDLHPLHKEIYGNEPIDEKLLESIKKHGVLNDLVITKDDLIISGRRRYLHCCHLGSEVISEVPCEIKEFEDELDLKEKLIEYNRYRKKTDSQLSAEIKFLNEIYSKQAEKRKLANLKQNNNVENEPTEMVKTPFRDDVKNVGTTRTRIANELGISEDAVRKLEKVRKASESEDPNIAEVGRRLLHDNELKKSKKNKLLMNFMGIYGTVKNKNPKIRDYAQGLIIDIVDNCVKIEDAHAELKEYKNALKRKEKALENEYGSEDYENNDEYPSDDITPEDVKEEEAIRNPSTIINPEKAADFLNTLNRSAKPVDDSPKPIFKHAVSQEGKPKVSPKYQAVMDACNDDRVMVAEKAKILLKNIDDDVIDADMAYDALLDVIRESKALEEKARREMLKVPDEPGEIVEKKFDSPENSGDNASSLEGISELTPLKDMYGKEIPFKIYKGEDEYRRNEDGTLILSVHGYPLHNNLQPKECQGCTEYPEYCVTGHYGPKPPEDGSLEDKTKTLIKLSMKAAKKENDWTMENHMLLNEVLQAHSK